MPARLLGRKRTTGGEAEVFLLRERFDVEPKADASAVWDVLVRPGKRLKPGAIVDFADGEGAVALSAKIIDWGLEGGKGERIARLSTERPSLDEALHAVGRTPLPPYIKHYAGDEEMYQTVYSHDEKSAAAPTAGLHFTPELIERLRAVPPAQVQAVARQYFGDEQMTAATLAPQSMKNRPRPRPAPAGLRH